ncbi:hypothetical protein BDR26DRAFT_850862 [Obelidium mucronatum]|nr:hypothetical protein BDR26DRAFT_850862 [Obelidium mucronatum]
MVFSMLLLAATAIAQNTGTMSWFGDAGDWKTVGTTACGPSRPPINEHFFAAVSYKSLSNQQSAVASGVCQKCILINNSVKVTVVGKPVLS